MKSIKSLSLREKFIIIAHQPDKGRFVVNDLVLNNGIIGALLLELSSNELVYIKDKKITVKSKKTKDTLLSQILDKVSDSSKERSVKTWVRRLNSKSKKYKWSILNSLSDKKIMRIEKRKFMGLIPYKLTYFTEDKVRESLIQDVRDSVLNTKKVSNEELAFLGLIEACKLQNLFCSSRTERKEFKKNLKVKLENNPINDAVSNAIKEMQAAVVGVIAGAAVASAVTSSN